MAKGSGTFKAAVPAFMKASRAPQNPVTKLAPLPKALGAAKQLKAPVLSKQPALPKQAKQAKTFGSGPMKGLSRR